MQEIAQEVFAYLKDSPLVSLAIAFVAGMAADKTVAYERRSSIFFFLSIGLLALFPGEFVIFYFRLVDYLEKISEFRVFFDFIAGYVGSFVIAAITHFVRPT